MADLNELGLEELSRLPDWMVPPSRRTELDEYKKAIRRAQVQQADETAPLSEVKIKPGDRVEDPRGWWSPRGGIGIGGSSSPGPSQPKTGPRGGRYTEAVTKDGRPYRRYF
jgi:hypothetical protein